MFYEINSKKIFKLIGLPHEIISYLNELDETTLKVLILIFSENEPLSKIELATRLKKTIPEIEQALKKLEGKKIISFPQQNSTEIKNSSQKIEILNNKTLKINNVSVVQKTNSVQKIEEPSAFQITAKEIIDYNKKNPEIKMLYEGAEKIYSRPLTSVERRELAYVAQMCGNLQIDAILIAIDFCNKNKKAMPQIRRICEDWSNKGILSYRQAEKQIKTMLENEQIENKVKKCFGIYNRALSSQEKTYILKWVKTYNFNIYMIKEAFNRCVDSIGQLSFPYIEKIMCGWHKNGIKTEQQLKNFDSKYYDKNRGFKRLSRIKNKKRNNYEIIANIDEQCKKRDEAFMRAQLKCMGISD